jgi:hypothetical protein
MEWFENSATSHGQFLNMGVAVIAVAIISATGYASRSLCQYSLSNWV